MPKVSVVIPVYGVEKYIERCVRSLFGQTLDSMEYVFIDDCSPDNSIVVMQKVLEEFPHRKEQVKLIRHEVNQGVGAARNHGVAACTGDYIIHCDSDDWVDLDFYEKMYDKAIETDADVVCAPFVTEFSESCHPSIRVYPKKADDVAGYIEKNVGLHLNSLWSKLYKREVSQVAYMTVPENIGMGEDLLANILMLHECCKQSFISDAFYHYWQSSTSITHNFSEKHFMNLQGIVNILEEKYPCKYFNVRQHVKMTLFLATLRNLHKESCLLPLFDEAWFKTSFRERLAMIFSRNCTLKGRAILTLTCISKTLTVRLLSYLYRKECR